MTTRFLVLAGVAVLALAGAGAGVASALNDLPQDAVPVRDPTSVLNTQPAVPPPPPVEPAPEGEPAPASPVAVTPPAPSIVIAEDDPIEIDPVEEKTEAAPPVKAVETPVEPSRRQRRRVAIVEAIDKITAESMRFEVEVGGRPVRFKRSLIFTARACEVSAPDEQVTDAVAYLEVAVQPRGILRASDPRQIFRGWMFASSPAINGLEHPVYDAWVVGCKA
jgi:hypothetical protein